MKTPRHTVIRRSAALLVMSVFGTLSAHAAPLAYDSFESYTAGSNIHGQSGGTGWNGAWSVQNISGGASGSATVSAASEANSISYNKDGVVRGGGQSLRLDGNSNGLQRNVFSTIDTSGADYYVSMIFQFTGGVFAGWQAKDANVDIGNDSIGLVNGSNLVQARVDGGNNVTGTTLSTNTTYFMVIQYTGWTVANPQYTTVNVWIDAKADQGSSTISATFTDSTPGDGGGSSGFLGLYARIVPNSGQTLRIDDLQIGTDWASVTSTVPEPGSASLIAAGLAGCLVLTRRRGRRG